MRLELRDITKQFPGVLANDRISISADRGKVLGLLGENGAGKTTLMNILSGLYKPDSGQIFIDGEERVFDGSRRRDPRRRRHGPPALHARPGVRRRRGRRAGRRDRHQPVRHLRPGRGRKRIVGALRPVQARRRPGREDREPAGRRPPAGRDPQGALPPERHPRPRRAAAPCSRRSRRRSCSGSSAPSTAAGTTVIFITHKLNEVLEVADDIVVLRRGRVAGTADPKTATRQELANLMVGRDVELIVPKGPAKPGDVVLSLRGRAGPRRPPRAGGQRRRPRGPGRRDRRHRRACRATGRPSSSRRSPGSARSTRARRRSPATTSRRRSPRQVSDLGVAHIPEDRGRDGLIATMTVAENYILDTYHRAAVQPARHLRPRGGRRAGRARASRTSTSGPRRSTPRPARCRAATSRRSSWRASSPCR